MKKSDFLAYQFLIDEFLEGHLKYAKTRIEPKLQTIFYTGKWENILLQFVIVIALDGVAVVKVPYTMQMESYDLRNTNPEQYERAEQLRLDLRTKLNTIN